MSDLDKRIAVARGDRPADLLLRGGRLVNVHSGRIEPRDLAIADGRVAASGGGYEGEIVHDLDGAFLVPSFIEPHIHVESSMATPLQFARAVAPRGTGTVICDPHEIANVMGAAGVRWLLAAGEELPLELFCMAPSCVPATHLESAGAELGLAEITELMEQPRVLGLAEMMNFPGVVNRDPGVLAKLAAAGERPRDGHAPGLVGSDLAAYAAAGIGSDHECVTVEEALAKLDQAMMVMIREGSSARNLAELARGVTPENAARWMLCSDDRTAADLLNEGHIDHLLRRAVAEGLDALTALRMVTLNPAAYFGLGDRGVLAPGRRADVVVLEDLESFAVRRVYRGGELIAEAGRLLVEPVSALADPGASVNLGELPAEALAIADPGPGKIRVIRALPDQLFTPEEFHDPRRENGRLPADPERDLIKLAVIERHRGTGRVGLGFLSGSGLKRGALASTVAHDSHNLIVLGADDTSMWRAIRALDEMGGGKVVVEGETLLAALPLPVAGLMSGAPIAETAGRLGELTSAARGLGCGLPEPFMTLSFMALPVIPQLKLTDRGLVDVTAFDFVGLAQ